MARARARMRELGVDVLLLSTGADLPYLTGYEAMPLERLTMLVLPRRRRRRARDPAPRGAPGRRAPRRVRVVPVGRDRRSRSTSWPAWSRGSAAASSSAAIGDHTWARFVLDLQDALPDVALPPCDRRHRAAPGREGRRRDRGPPRRRTRRRRRRRGDARHVRSRDAPSSTCTASWSSACSKAGTSARTSPSSPPGRTRRVPHHDPSDRVIADGDVVLCDFGGTMHGLLLRHHADVRGRRPGARGARRLRGARRGPGGGRACRRPSVPACEAVDAAARSRDHRRRLRRLLRAPHRSRHRHRGPRGPLRGRRATPRRSFPGTRSASSPGIYLPGRFGLRLEDIVVATDAGPERLNHAARDLASVE